MYLLDTLHTAGVIVNTGRTVRGAGLAAAALLLSVAVFQVALAAGAPVGRAAWSGTRPDLPAGLRIASGAAAFVLVLLALVVARRAGWTVRAPLPDRWLGATCWVIAGLLALNTASNLASTSSVERGIMGPTTAVLTVLVATVAHGRRRSSGQRSHS
jgi:hypothetical protein